MNGGEVPRCPSCGRPLAVRLSRCPYCAETIPGSALRRAIITLAIALPAIAVVLCARGRLPSLPPALGTLFRSPVAVALLSLAAIALFATWPASRPGVASLSTADKIGNLALRTFVFVLIILAATLAVGLAT